MTELVSDKKLHILCVNQEKFVFHPSKIASFALSVFRNKSFTTLFRYLSEPKTFLETIDFVSEQFNIDKDASSNIINSMMAKGFIRKCDNHYDYEKVWNDNNWRESLLFHLHTNSLPKMMYNSNRGEKDDISLMEEYVKDAEVPSSYKNWEGKNIHLNKPEINKEFTIPTAQYSQKKKSTLNLSTLSRLLYYAYGQIGTRHMRVTGEHIRKTVPSGGSRHPIEVYLIVTDMTDLPTGIYHYNVKNHALTEIKTLTKEAAIKIIQGNILLDENRPGFPYSMAIIYSCTFARSMFRYREARSYRVMHYDLGHITQNLSFLAKAYGLNLYSGYSCHEKEIENLIGLNSLMESIMSYSVI